MTDGSLTRGVSELERADLLISRVADGEASEQDWQDLGVLAERRPELWKDLAQAQRQHGELSLAVNVALAGAEGVGLSPAQHMRGGVMRGHRAGFGALRGWGGWLVAASLGVVMLTGWRAGSGNGLGNGAGSGQTLNASGTLGGRLQASGIPAGWTSEDVARAYVLRGQDEGRVYGELPERLLLEARPRENGSGYDVTYVRQFVERAQVKDLMKFGQDEAGQRMPVRVVPVRHGEPQ